MRDPNHLVEVPEPVLIDALKWALASRLAVSDCHDDTIRRLWPRLSDAARARIVYLLDGHLAAAPRGADRPGYRSDPLHLRWRRLRDWIGAGSPPAQPSEREPASPTLRQVA